MQQTIDLELAFATTTRGAGLLTHGINGTGTIVN
jgi:hypothetical protein